MKNLRNIILLSLVLALFSFSFSGCKGFGSPDYTLNVIITDGCTGTPDTGTYTMSEFDLVEYEYFPPTEGVQIEVIVNKSERGSSGSVFMYNNVTMTVQIIDIRDDWEFTYVTIDGTEAKMTVTFTGDSQFAGTFTDSNGYSGTWTVESDDFIMTYSDWADYVFSGSVITMSGEYTGEGIVLGWSAVRIQ